VTISASRSKRRLVDGIDAGVLARLSTIYAARFRNVRLGVGQPPRCC